jgi:hypothetical protein
LVEKGRPAILLKGLRDQPLPPTPWAPATTPANVSYDLEDLFPSLQVGNLPEIDAMSTGNDVIPRANQYGAPIMNGSWMALAISVENQENGDNPGILTNQYAQFGGDTGASIFSYYFEGSSGITPALVNSEILEASRTHLGYHANSKTDVSAIDHGIGLITYDVAQLAGLPIANDVQFYFSVTPTWASANATLNFAFSQSGVGTGTPTETPDAGVVYLITRAGSAWSQPVVFRTVSEMQWALWPAVPGQTTPTGPHAFDIDMLAVDPVEGTIIFSTSSEGPQLSPLMIQQEVVSGTAGAYSTMTLCVMDAGVPVPVHDKVRLGDNGKVNGGCSLDPEAAMRFKIGGIAVSQPTPSIAPMGLSLVRGALDLLSKDSFCLQATGWGDAPAYESMTTVVGFFSYTPNGGIPAPPVYLGAVLRDPFKSAEFTFESFPAQVAVGAFYAEMWSLPTATMPATKIATSWTCEILL